MADDPCGESTKEFIIRAQKSTNMLKALLARVLPSSTGGVCSEAECSGGAAAVDALLSDITDSLSRALASLALEVSQGQRLPGQGFEKSGGGSGGGRVEPSPRRSGQRVRTNAARRMVVLVNEPHDSYTWKKYGQKGIFGARFPRSYFRCGNKSGGCQATKRVQRSDADPSKLELEVTYIGTHTCDDPPQFPSHQLAVPDHQQAVSSGVRGGADPPALLKAGYHQLQEETTSVGALSMEEEEEDMLLVIPSPVCSQSELLLPAVEVPKQAPDDQPPFMLVEDDDDDDDNHIVSDYVVPQL